MEGTKAWESLEPGAGLPVDWPLAVAAGYPEEERIPPVYRTVGAGARRSRHRDDTGSVRSRTRMDFDHRVTGAMPGQFLR
jgi:hypothetical protein